MVKRSVFRTVLGVIFVALFSLVQCFDVFAIIDFSTLDFFSQNNILYYNPAQKDCVVEKITGDKVTIIGDSLAVGARAEYDAQLTGSDYMNKTYYGKTYELTQVSKHFFSNANENYSGMEIADVMQTQGDLRKYVVFQLGTNDEGALTNEKLDGLVDLLGTNHKIVLVTNYDKRNESRYDGNNQVINATKEKYAGKVAVADFAEAAKGEGASWFSEDGIHLNAEGNKGVVQLVVKALNTFSGSSNGGFGSGNNRNYAGVQVWSDAQMAAIQANQSIYQEAANAHGFPWQILAVVHYLESSLARRNPSNGQGVYQLYGYTGGGRNANRFPPGPITEEEFRRQSFLAADEISEHAGNRDLNEVDNIKWLFFAYNGQAKQYKEKALKMGFSPEQANNGEGSSYVMNRADAQRDPTSSGMSPYWPGRFTDDGHYDPSSTSTRFGAFVLYSAIAGVATCTSQGGGTIVDTAVLLSWEGHGHSKFDPKSEYVVAMREVGSYKSGCGHGTCAPIGASCDQFVGTVMRYSGADTEFPVFGPATQEEHMRSHPEMYVEIEHHNDLSVLEPGDIFVTHGGNGNHIYLYLGKLNGGNALMQASASFNDRTGEHFNGVYFSDHGGARQYKVWRRINY